MPSINAVKKIAPQSEISRDSEPDIDNALLFRVFQTTNLMHKTGTNWVVEMGITTQQWSVLGALSRMPPSEGIFVGEFAELLMLSRQNLSSVLGRLEAQDLTARVADHPDGRFKKVVLTKKGRALWTRLDRAIKDYCHSALRDFSDQEKRTFIRFVDKLRKNLVSIDWQQGHIDPDT